MDLTRPVTYRGVDINDATVTPNGIEGTLVQSVRYAGVPGVGYTEKRAVSDGRYASDVYQDQRVVEIAAVTHALTRGDLYDRIAAIVAAFTPTAAYAESPGDKGFLPLQFFWPTDRIADFGVDGEVQLFINARPVAQPHFVIERDTQGGDDTDEGGIQWSVQLAAIDPRIYILPRNDTDLNTETSPVLLTNRGYYPSPLDTILVIPADSGTVTFTITGAGADLALSIPNDPLERTVRISSTDQVVTSQLAGGQQTLAMGLITSFDNDRQWPVVQPGVPVSVAFTCNITPAAGSRLMFYEAFA